MIFPERLKSIDKHDWVLEIGPGGNPHPRSNILLEKKFDEEEAYEQRGRSGKLTTNKKVIYYEGDKFPFKDKEFDYVICSHVLEHISSDQLPLFISEVLRVAKKGYFEFPTIYYEYLYNFKVHLTLLLYSDGVLSYFPKEKSDLDKFKNIQSFFYASALKGHISHAESLKDFYFQGFEWFGELKLNPAKSVDEVLYNEKHYSSIEPLVIKNKKMGVVSFFLRQLKKII